MSSARKQRVQLIEMLGALEGQLRLTARVAKELEAGFQKGAFSDYMTFRRKVDEMRSLSAIIEMRLEAINDFEGMALDDLRTQFVALDILVIRMLVRCAGKVFQAQSERRIFPLGVCDLLPSEVKVLRDVAERLGQPHYFDHGDSAVLDEIEAVIALLLELQDQASSLPDFSQEPSVAEWLGQRQLGGPSGGG